MVLVRTVIDALFIAYYFQVYSFTFVMPGTDSMNFSTMKSKGIPNDDSPHILPELRFWDNPKKNNINVIEHHVTMLSLAMLTDQNKRLWLFTSCLQLDASQFWLVSLNSSHLEWARFMKLGPTDTTVSPSSPEIKRGFGDTTSRWSNRYRWHYAARSLAETDQPETL